MFYVFHGDNRHAQRDALAKLKAKSGDPAMLELNTSQLDGKGLTVNELRAACSAMPFLSPVRLVIVDDYFSSKPSAADIKAMVAYLPALPDFARLVFLESKELRKTNKLIKLAQDKAVKGYVRAYMLPKGNELDRWIMRRVKEQGGQIAPQAANLLAANVGSDMYILENEVEKLLLYRGTELIQPGDVKLLSPYAAEANIFDLVDAMGNRNGRKAAALLQQKLDDGEDPFRLFSMVVRQFRLLIQVKESAETGLRAHEIGKTLKLHSFVAGKLYKQSQSFSLAQLEQIYAHLLEIDVGAKTGQHDMTTALSLLVAGLATA
jgi:DNA polymerase-3 subunit delta